MSKLSGAVDSQQSTLRLTGDHLVVVSPTKMDEACISVPAMRALRNARPDLDLTILTPDSVAPLWSTVQQLNRIVTFPDDASAGEIGKILSKCDVEFDSSLAWEASNGAVAVAKARVPQRLGYNLKRLGKRLTDRVELDPPAGPLEHRVLFYMNLVEKLGIDAYQAANFQTGPLPPRPNPPRIALVPDSDRGDSYEWDVERFCELGKTLLAHYPLELVILAHPEHTAKADELEGLFNGAVRNFSHQFDMAGLLNALAHCSFLIANDSTIVHLAAHFGIPTLALFGPGDPVATRPLGRQHLVISQHVECSPCHQNRCPLEDHFCMEELSVGRVLEALHAYLQPQE